jgi:hypothetical protein
MLRPPSTPIPSLVQRALFGGLVFALFGALELWFYRFDLRHLAAALSGGAVFGILLALLTRPHNGSLPAATLSSALFGAVAAAVWWLVAQPPTSLILALVIGFGMGGLFAWSELH